MVGCSSPVLYGIVLYICTIYYSNSGRLLRHAMTEWSQQMLGLAVSRSQRYKRASFHSSKSVGLRFASNDSCCGRTVS